MEKYSKEGTELRYIIKNLIMRFIKDSPECKSNAEGLRQTVIFRECGMDWGNKRKATSTNQQYWVIAALCELEEEGLIIQDLTNNKWRLSE
ncbi:MAG: hypothetical protein AB7S72_15310 [Draconibacterium sp.]